MQKPHYKYILKSLIFGCPKNVIKGNQISKTSDWPPPLTDFWLRNMWPPPLHIFTKIFLKLHSNNESLFEHLFQTCSGLDKTMCLVLLALFLWGHLWFLLLSFQGPRKKLCCLKCLKLFKTQLFKTNIMLKAVRQHYWHE